DRSRSYSCSVVRKNSVVGDCWQSEGELQRLGSSRVYRETGVCVADGLRGVQRESFAKGVGFGLHRKAGGTSSEDVLPRGIDHVPQEARSGLRRAIHFRVSLSERKTFVPPLPGLGLFFEPSPRLAPWATVCRRYA